MRQISTRRFSKQTKAATLTQIEGHLNHTAWARGGQILAGHKSHSTTDGRIVSAWPGARPAQIKAGAKKLYDVIAAQVRREARDGEARNAAVRP